MFGHRFFGSRFWGSRFWGDGGGSIAATPPNFVVFVTDDLTKRLLDAVPQIASGLRANGTEFTRAYTGTSLCMPARASMQTGQFGHNNGITDNSRAQYLTIDFTKYLARRLQLAGYQTGQYGKTINGYITSDGVPIGYNYWHGTGTQAFYNYDINDNGVVSSIGSGLADYVTTLVTQRVLTDITTVTPPFYFNIGYKAPHFNAGVGFYDITPDVYYAALTLAVNRISYSTPNFNQASHDKPDWVDELLPLDAATIIQLDTFFRNQIKTMFSVDRSIQTIIAALSAAGKLANTYLIFTSDNGYMYGEHRIPNQKYTPYETSINIPLIVRGPGVLAGRQCNRLVSHIDIVPTIYELSGATSALTMDGVSFASLLTNPTGPRVRNNAFVEWVPNTAPFNPPFYTIVGEEFKYTEYSTGELELYDMKHDAFELNNIAYDDQYAGVVATMAQLLAQGRTCTGTGCVL